MVEVIRTYKPDVIITHEPTWGEYNKTCHKNTGRAATIAFRDAGDSDKYPELKRIGLEPYQPKKLYYFCNPGGVHEPPTITFNYKSDSQDESEKYYIQRFLLGMAAYQSQGVSRNAMRTFRQIAEGKPVTVSEPLYLKESLVPTPEKEKSIFDGLQK